MSQSVREEEREAGFSLLEVLVATSVLAIGLMATALLMARTYASANRSRYMNMASTLASEKLEDLEHYKKTDAYLTPGGTLTADTNGYYDQVGMSMANGTYEEVTFKGVSSYEFFSMKSDGSQPTSQSTTTAPTTTGMTFDRRWLIENNVPVNGVGRLTVLVTLLDQTVQPPVTFQMSAVRECNVASGTAC